MPEQTPNAPTQSAAPVVTTTPVKEADKPVVLANPVIATPPTPIVVAPVVAPVNPLSLQKPTGHVEVNPAAPQPQGSQVLPAPVRRVLADPKVVTHIDKLAENIKAYKGQKDHNPFLWWAKNVEPIYTEYLKNPSNEQLAKQLLAIPLDSIPVTTTEDQFIPARNPASLMG